MHVLCCLFVFIFKVDRHDEDGMNEALDGELESENKREVTHSYADAGAEVVAGSNDVEAPGGADGLAEMREEQIAPIGNQIYVVE
jgi:hypothetical protein